MPHLDASALAADPDGLAILAGVLRRPDAVPARAPQGARPGARRCPPAERAARGRRPVAPVPGGRP
ncbi:MAG TPA: hypothetical protein VEA41_07840 [Salinarimonas sp.]|nr:hypothetical protein [Salinarimonas sp.]